MLSVRLLGLVAYVICALLVVALGVLAILAAYRVRRFRRRLRRAIGHVRSAEGWAVNDAIIQTVFGDIPLDLRDAQLPEDGDQLCLRQSAGDSARPQVNVAASVFVELGVEDDIAQLQASPWPQDAPDFRKGFFLFRDEVEHAVRNHHVHT